MAKSTSTSKSAKPKTAKKTAPAKTTAKSSAKTTKAKATKVTKATKKPAEKAKVNAAAAVPTKETTKEVKVAPAQKKARGLSFAKLRGLHLLSAGVFTLLAVMAYFFMDRTAHQLTLSHLTQDALNGQLVPAGHMLFGLELRWLVMGLLLVSAFLSLLRYRNAAREKAAVDRRIVPSRWIDFAITGAIMAETVALLSGMQDLLGLKLLAALVVFSAVFAWIAERENANAPRAVRGAFEASAASAALVLLALAVLTIATPLYGAVRAPWYVYAMFGTLVASALLTGLVQYREYRHQNGRAADYLTVERNYLVINLLSKVAFAAILIAGLAAR
jgi:hypothetical protein